MAIDASIPGQVTLPQINTPAQNAVAAAAQRAAQQRLDAEAREMQERQAVQQALTESGGDWRRALPKIRQAAPTAALEIEKQLLAQRKASVDMMRQEYAAEKDQTDRLLGRLAAIPKGDAATYARLLPQLQAEAPDDVRALLPEQYDEGRLTQLQQFGMTAAQRLERSEKAFDLLVSGKYRQGLGAELALATSQEDWDQAIAGARAMDVPDTVISTFGAKFSPAAAQRAGVMALSPAERLAEQNRQRDDARAQATAQAAAEERAIDNKRADAQLGISQAQLRVAQHRAAQATASAGQQKPLTANAESNIINRLTTQWSAATKKANELDAQIQLMDAGLQAARRGDMAQGSQTVLVTFQKILDPTSVVRESEFDRSAAGQSLINRVKGAMTRVAEGGNGVTLAELEKFAALAREARKAQVGNLGRIRGRIGKTADRYNIPHELVMEAVPGEEPAAASGETVVDGYKVRVKGK